MPHAHGKISKARRRRRALERGYVVSTPAGFKNIYVDEAVASRVQAVASSLTLQHRHSLMVDHPSHGAMNAALRVRRDIGETDFRKAVKIHRAANKAKHVWDQLVSPETNTSFSPASGVSGTEALETGMEEHEQELQYGWLFYSLAVDIIWALWKWVVSFSFVAVIYALTFYNIYSCFSDGDLIELCFWALFLSSDIVWAMQSNTASTHGRGSANVIQEGRHFFTDLAEDHGHVHECDSPHRCANNESEEDIGRHFFTDSAEENSTSPMDSSIDCNEEKEADGLPVLGNDDSLHGDMYFSAGILEENSAFSGEADDSNSPIDSDDTLRHDTQDQKDVDESVHERLGKEKNGNFVVTLRPARWKNLETEKNVHERLGKEKNGNFVVTLRPACLKTLETENDDDILHENDAELHGKVEKHKIDASDNSCNPPLGHYCAIGPRFCSVSTMRILDKVISIHASDRTNILHKEDGQLNTEKLDRSDDKSFPCHFDMTLLDSPGGSIYNPPVIPTSPPGVFDFTTRKGFGMRNLLECDAGHDLEDDAKQVKNLYNPEDGDEAANAVQDDGNAYENSSSSTVHAQGFVYRLVHAADPEYVECISFDTLRAVVVTSLTHTYRLCKIRCFLYHADQRVLHWKKHCYACQDLVKSRNELYDNALSSSQLWQARALAERDKLQHSEDEKDCLLDNVVNNVQELYQILDIPCTYEALRNGDPDDIFEVLEMKLTTLLSNNNELALFNEELLTNLNEFGDRCAAIQNMYTAKCEEFESMRKALVFRAGGLQTVNEELQMKIGNLQMLNHRLAENLRQLRCHSNDTLEDELQVCLDPEDDAEDIRPTCTFETEPWMEHVSAREDSERAALKEENLISEKESCVNDLSDVEKYFDALRNSLLVKGFTNEWHLNQRSEKRALDFADNVIAAAISQSERHEAEILHKSKVDQISRNSGNSRSSGPPRRARRGGKGKKNKRGDFCEPTGPPHACNTPETCEPHGLPHPAADHLGQRHKGTLGCCTESPSGAHLPLCEPIGPPHCAKPCEPIGPPHASGPNTACEPHGPPQTTADLVGPRTLDTPGSCTEDPSSAHLPRCEPIGPPHLPPEPCEPIGPTHSPTDQPNLEQKRTDLSDDSIFLCERAPDSLLSLQSMAFGFESDHLI